LSQKGKIPVVAIAGNHDSSDRVNVADVLARENGIIFIGKPTDTVPNISLEDFSITKTEVGFVELQLKGIDFPVRLLHTAFANELRLKEYFGDDKQASLQSSLSEKWQSLAEKYCDENGVNLLTTHLYMLKRDGEKLDEPEGERPLNIGNADVIFSDAIPKEIQYAALGHLHRYQDVGTFRPVIYSSSILPYSFSEAGQEKYVVIVDVKPHETPKLTKIPLTKGRKLERKHFFSVQETIEWLQANPNCLVELTLTTEHFLTVDERKSIYNTHDGIIYLIPDVKTNVAEQTNGKRIDLTKDIEQLFIDFFKSKNQMQAPNDELINLFNEIRKA